MSTLQNERNFLQNPLAIPAIGVAVLFAVAMWKPVVLLYAALVGVAAAFTWQVAERKRVAREAAARAASYVNICGPVVVASTHPAETVADVQARAEEFKKQMQIGGNPYAVEIPVIAYPFEPMLFGVGQLTAAWNIYQRLAGERQHAANLEWAERCPAQLKTIFLSQVMPAPKVEEQ